MGQMFQLNGIRRTSRISRIYRCLRLEEKNVLIFVKFTPPFKAVTQCHKQNCLGDKTTTTTTATTNAITRVLYFVVITHSERQVRDFFNH